MQQIIRTGLSLPLAGLITFGLGSLMAYLIYIEGPDTPPVAELDIQMFDFVLPETPVRIEPLQPENDVQAPPPPVRLVADAAPRPDTDYAVISGSIPDLEPANLIDRSPNFNVADSAGPPLVRIEPVYPARDAERGIEGPCTVYFDLGLEGQPMNVRAGDCPSASIARASIRAVERWRYQPRVVNGQAVARTNVSVVLDFNLE